MLYPVASKITGQVYPWDLAGDSRRAHSWVGAGVSGVAIAVNYHAVRAVHWQPDGSPRVIQLDASAHHLPIREACWSGHPIRPLQPSGLPDDLFAQAVMVARDVGLQPTAWFAATHFDGAFSAGLQRFATVDAWGNRSSYSLCPSWPEVRAYSRGIVRDVVRETGVTSFLVESIGAPGFAHSVAHDKSEFAALDAQMTQNLSLCFCAACTERTTQAGRDPERERAIIRRLPSEQPRQDEFALVTAERDADRVEQVSRFTEELGRPIDGQTIELTIAATTDIAARSAFAPFTQRPSAPVGLCADLSAPEGRGWFDVSSWESWPGVTRSGTVALTGSASLRSMLGSASAANPISTPLDELYLYHLGLFPPDRLAELDIAALTRT